MPDEGVEKDECRKLAKQSHKILIGDEEKCQEK